MLPWKIKKVQKNLDILRSSVVKWHRCKKQSYPLSPCRHMRSAQWSTIFSKCKNTEFTWIAGFKNSYLFLLHLEVQVISDLMINEQIRDREVRVIGPDGEQLGIMSAKEAYLKAKDADLDLVKIAPTAKPPVCKIINYGKFRYDQARKEKEAKKKQRTIDVKEIRLSPNIDTNDLNTKANQARKFLSKGDKVKVTLRFRGREMAHKDVGREVLNAFYEKLEDVAVIDKEAKMEGRSMIMFLTAAK